jgi:hypothetical protein
MSLPLRIPVALVLACALAAALAGCGGSERTEARRAAATTTVAAHGPARYLDAIDLRRDLANGFRDGLYRLAVMTQPADASSDLGQDLPTGTVGAVRCGEAAARPAGTAPWMWGCSVRWHTVDGAPRTTRYDVRLLPTGCFAAGATPRYPPQRDTTIKTFSEHPLNAIASATKACA